jgi:hypothetical protein
MKVRFLRGTVLAAVSVVLLSAPFTGSSGDAQTAAAQTGRGSGWAALSSAVQGVVSGAVGRDDIGYRVRSLTGVPSSENPGQHFGARFLPTGVEVGTGNSRWGLGLAAIGLGDALAAVPAAIPVTEANRVDYRRGSITEWYRNGPAGLEQGFTLAERPVGILLPG